MHDLLITGGLVVDGTGLAGRVADVAIADGRVVGIGRHRGEQAQRAIDADGLVVAPGIVDAHTHYDPQITWDGLCDTAALHGVTTVAAGNCGFGVAPCRSDDHEYLGQLFARVEGMDLAALGRIEWGFESFPEFLASREGRLGLNFGMYVGHSAVRRWVLGDAAYERAATDDEVAAMVALVDDAMAAGALGFSSSLAPTHLDLADRPIPSRLASLDEVRALADAVGRYGRGSIAFAPESAVEGISAEDRDLLIELARRGRVPTITQGLGGRSKVDAPTKTWEESRRFLDRSAALGTPVYSLLMTRPLNGPFTVAEGTSRYEGVPSWHALMTATLEEKRRLLADPAERERLRHGIDHPNLDPAKGTTLPPPFWESLRLSSTSSEADRRWQGRAMSEVAAERGVHPADALLDLALADDLQAVFHWSNETPAWRELLKDVQRHPQMIVGVSDGGAHLDRDDGQEWSTHFLATWWRNEQVWRLEEAIRLMTAIPAAILGLADRGVLAAGRPADVFLFDPERLDVGTCRRQDDPVIGVPRFRGVPVGIEATIVNGTVVVERGERGDARPGQVVRPGVTLLLGTDCEPVCDLAIALDADLVAVPEVEVPAPGTDWGWGEALEAWRASAACGPKTGAVVVAPWTADLGDPVALVDLPLDEWVARCEVPFARWFAAMGVAAARCADGGSIVALVEQAAPLDCSGRAAETGLSDAVETLARSLARSEGLRGVRVNTVTTPARITRPPVIQPPPPLDTFPGTLTIEAAGAVRALLGHDALGITATTVHADAGRTGR